ncbi:hypothetical protein [Hyphomonas sp. GM-8P]|uniref:hypothetical protein n=1 Tax=Hyphomonas sp. GM-8P TaxID=1280945 RepID=UPI000DBFA814|nr:hypothetical protein [Hyphomonas sp. GM-8P]RAN38736.1 hypothetical protein HY26_17340 [Hyphomonas sp. GM-8P]
MGTILNLLLGIVLFLVSALATWLLALGIGWLLKFVWQAPAHQRGRAGLIVIFILEIGVTVALWDEIAYGVEPSDYSKIMFSIFMRGVVYYSIWTFFGEEAKRETGADQNDELPDTFD